MVMFCLAVMIASPCRFQRVVFSLAYPFCACSFRERINHQPSSVSIVSVRKLIIQVMELNGGISSSVAMIVGGGMSVSAIKLTKSCLERGL